MSLTDMLKIALGRKLSQRQMERAKGGDPNHVPGDASEREGSGTFDNIAIVGDKIEYRKRKYKFRVTPDASEGSKVLHRGFYPVEDEERTYNKDGLLEKRTVSYMPGGLSVIDTKRLVYEPAGCWIGKRKREARR